MITIDILRKPTDEEWARCYMLAVGTEGKETVKVPSESWKHRILLAEHSPIRSLVWTIRLHGVPYYVSNHLVRHKYGVEWYVQSQRNDRQSNYDRTKAPQDEPVMVTFEANAQALINISRRRLCRKADVATRDLWYMVCEEIISEEPAMAGILVPDCVYRGRCCEMYPCGEKEG